MGAYLDLDDVTRHNPHARAQLDQLTRELDEARAEVERLREQFENASLVSKAKQERLAKCCTQRGARMQIMREWLDSGRGIGPPTEWWYFCEERPNAKDWFDEDGVPK